MWSNEIGHKGERGKDIKKKEGRIKEREPWCEEREKGRREEEKERKKKKERGRKRKKGGGEVAGCGAAGPAKNYIFRWFPGLLRIILQTLVTIEENWSPLCDFITTLPYRRRPKTDPAKDQW